MKQRRIYITIIAILIVSLALVGCSTTSKEENKTVDNKFAETQESKNKKESMPTTGSTRDLLLYEVNNLTNDEKGLEGMMNQVFYYSESSYENLVDYFDELLKGTEDYSLYVQEDRTSIDGTINGEMVIVIINNYMKTEPEVGMNGINVNYYED